MKLSTGKPHISRVWAMSKLANGTPLKDENTTYQYKTGAGWRALWKLGLKRKDVLAAALAKEYYVRRHAGQPWDSFARTRNPPHIDTISDDRTSTTMVLVAGGGITVNLPTVWDLNDFGAMAFHVPGTQAFVHTTPSDEAQFARGLPETLEFSHGCIHIRPSDRETMTLGRMAAGRGEVHQPRVPIRRRVGHARSQHRSREVPFRLTGSPCTADVGLLETHLGPRHQDRPGGEDRSHDHQCR